MAGAPVFVGALCTVGDMITDVLVRARLSADGATVMVAPGVELAAGSVDVVADIPSIEEMGARQALPCVLFFGSQSDLDAFAEQFADWLEAGMGA